MSVLLLLAACGAGSHGADSDVAGDGDADSDADADSDTDADSDADADPGACVDGETRNDDSCANQCSFCSAEVCSGGTWQVVENAPAGSCCDPLDPGCREGEACYYEASTTEFHCMAAGSLAPSAGCDADNDCQGGSTCLDTPWGTRECTMFCDPSPDSLDERCPDDCMELSAWGYDSEEYAGVCGSPRA